MLDASQAMSFPLGLTTADLSDPGALMRALPVVAASPDPSSPVQAVAGLPASVAAVAGLPALPTPASLADPATSAASPVLSTMTLAPTSTLSADAASISGSIGGTGGGTGVVLTLPYNSSRTITDAAGDTETVTVAYNPNPDGTFTFIFSLTYSYGTPPAPRSPIADDATNTNGGSGSFTFTITAGLDSITFAEDQTDSDSYNIDEALTGASSSGTFTDSGHDSSNSHDSITFKDDGTGSETYSSGSKSSDRYALSLTGTTADGKTFTETDGGSDSSSYSDAGTVAGDGSGSDTHQEDDTSTETATLGESGNGWDVTSTSTETVGYHDGNPAVPGATGPALDVATTTDLGNDWSLVKGSGTINGASFTVRDKETDSYDNSDTLTTGAATGPTEDRTLGGSNSATFNLTLNGVADTIAAPIPLGGYGVALPPTATTDDLTETNTSSSSYHEHVTVAPDATGVAITTSDNGGTTSWSDNESGDNPAGPFSLTVSQTTTGDVTATSSPTGVTITGSTQTTTPDNVTQTGTIDPSSPLMITASAITMMASTGNISTASSDLATALSTITVPPMQTQPATQGDTWGQTFSDWATNVGAFFQGGLQGGLNGVNAGTNTVTGVANLPATAFNYTFGWIPGMPQTPYFPYSNWSYNLVVTETPGEHNASMAGWNVAILFGSAAWGGPLVAKTPAIELTNPFAAFVVSSNGALAQAQPVIATIPSITVPAGAVVAAGGLLNMSAANGPGEGGGSGQAPNRPPSPNQVNPNVPAPQVPPDSLFGRSFQDFGRDVLRWGTGAEGATARAQGITLQELLQGGVTGAHAQAVRDFYAGVLARNSGNAAAAARVQLADRILQLLGGG